MVPCSVSLKDPALILITYLFTYLWRVCISFHSIKQHNVLLIAACKLCPGVISLYGQVLGLMHRWFVKLFCPIYSSAISITTILQNPCLIN